ncbi:MAG TPA: substrate-binding domain-containing protein [Gemmatimonadaceae bacterium]
MRKLFTFAICLAALVGAAPAGAQQYRVIVNAQNTTTTLSKEDLARVYLKKMSTWKNGAAVTVVDQGPKSPVRAVFSMAVLGRDVPTMKNYWQQSLFSGRGVPPLEQPTEAQVVAFVAANPGAIGYVSGDAQLPESVKTVTVTQ